MFSDETTLGWLPDETLFSLCSRYHRLSGNRLASASCQQLFGHHRCGSAHDFPSRLAHFAEVTRGQLGTPSEIALARTLVAFYLPFASPEIANAAVSEMAGESIGSLKFRLGLLTSRFRANHPLKACPECMERDRRAFGTAYWHRSHQLPGVWVCLEHHEWLQISNVKATGVGRFQWFLPHPCHLESLRRADSQVPTPLVQQAMNAIAIVGCPRGWHFDAVRVRGVYRNALRQRGYLSRGRANMRLREIGPTFLAHLQAGHVEGSTPELQPQTCKEAAARVARLVYGYRPTTHPMHHLQLIGWLFENFEEFVLAYTGDEPAADADPQAASKTGGEPKSQMEGKKRQFASLLDDGLAVTSAARQVGVDATTGMVWAASVGVATPTRAKRIDGPLRTQLVTALRDGQDKAAVALLGTVSISTVTRLLRTEPGLQAHWHEARRERAQEFHRNRWTAVVTDNPLAGVKAARLLEPATYAWLYRNDKEWLEAQQTSMPPAARNAGLHVAWDDRDEALSRSVREAVLRIATEAPGRRIHLWMIYQRLPDLKAKIRKLDRLPLTLQAIRAAIGNRGQQENRIEHG